MNVRVDLHRIAAGGSIRVIIDGGPPSYLTEAELRERLRQVARSPEEIEKIVADLSAGRGEHRLNISNPSPELAASLVESFTGAPRPAERSS